MTNMIGSFRFSKKVAKQSPEDGDVNPEVIKKRKNRKKKKGKLPKNYNPEVDPDPERWLPRWERSTFKHKKTKRGMNAVGKGTQGSSASAEQLPSSPKPTSPKPSASTNPVPDSPSAPNVVPPRQQKPGAKSKAKKKKGKGW